VRKLRVPRGLVVALSAVAIVSGAFCLAFYWPWLTRPPIGPPKHALPDGVQGPIGERPPNFEDRFLGHGQDAIVARFGPPTHHFEGHYGCPPVSYKLEYPGAHTNVYAGPAGSLYLSFCRERGRWVCFSATWLEIGSVV
jgi:hypothetical protein